ncbi:MAG: hypothetical protein EZS28_056195, partial [Streblomastix strix]
MQTAMLIALKLDQ